MMEVVDNSATDSFSGRPAPLDNAVWHSLIGRHARHARAAVPAAEVGPLALRFDPELAPFAALPDVPTVDAWRALASLVGEGETVVLMRDHVEAPPDWNVTWSVPGVQMVGDRVEAARSERAEPLGAADVADMLDLVDRTRPGPFRPRTFELGGYVGLRHDGVLIAMAGERLTVDGYREISAVCTDDDHRGRGFASELMRHLVATQRARGEIPVLHAAASNARAIRLYESMGFQQRRQVDVVQLAPDRRASTAGIGR